MTSKSSALEDPSSHFTDVDPPIANAPSKRELLDIRQVAVPGTLPSLAEPHRSRPNISRLEPPTALLSKISKFLPQIEQANKQLYAQLETGGLSNDDINIESVDSGSDRHIEMNLDVGIFDVAHPPQQPAAITMSVPSSDERLYRSDVQYTEKEAIDTTFTQEIRCRSLSFMNMHAVDANRKQEIADNLMGISARIHLACGDSRHSNEIRLVSVSKTKPVSDIAAAYDLGLRHFGENVQELVEKAAVLPSDIHWHFIGSIQTNKCKVLAGISNLWAVESIDSIKKADAMNKACYERANALPVFLQVNTSGEESKSGLQESQCLEAAKHILDMCDKLKLMGLMCIGAPQNVKDGHNPDFDMLVRCKLEIESNLGLSGLELSMGMSDDFESAISNGSTNVRIGSGIFGSRLYSSKP
ncbi:YggS family pyridoxal phosphate enzyme [Batrachochytrium salamandrivorans]|nr:YggS family pyridoxal phosphate enzyme [Batrachochytrium salamandrivorans]